MENAIIKSAELLEMSVTDFIARKIFLLEQQKGLIDEKLVFLRADLAVEMEKEDR